MTRSKRKTFVTSSQILQRQKQMLRLMERYTALISTPGQWVIPYKWSVYFRTMESYETECEEITCYTNIAAFVAMLFEAKKLPKTIIITGMAINGLEADFHKIVFSPLTEEL